MLEKPSSVAVCVSCSSTGATAPVTSSSFCAEWKDAEALEAEKGSGDGEKGWIDCGSTFGDGRA